MITLFYYHNPKLERTIYRIYDSSTCTAVKSDTLVGLFSSIPKISNFKTLESYVESCCTANAIPISAVTILDDFSSETYPEYFI